MKEWSKLFVIVFDPSRDGVGAEHSQGLVDLVHADRLLPLLQVAHEAEAEPRPQSELLLRQSRLFAVRFDKFGDLIHAWNYTLSGRILQYPAELSPIGYNLAEIDGFIPYRV